jgi:hypothetical protein
MKHTEAHKAEWIMDSPKTKKNPFGGKLHFECSEKNCEIYGDMFKCPTCSRRMDFQEKEQGICGDCGLAQMFSNKN